MTTFSSFSGPKSNASLYNDYKTWIFVKLSNDVLYFIGNLKTNGLLLVSLVDNEEYFTPVLGVVIPFMFAFAALDGLKKASKASCIIWIAYNLFEVTFLGRKMFNVFPAGQEIQRIMLGLRVSMDLFAVFESIKAFLMMWKLSKPGTE